MATAATGWACTHSASIISQNDTSATIRVTCYWKNQGWRYNMNYVSAWVYCNGSECQVKSSGWIDTTGDNQGSYSMGYHDFVISKNYGWQNISCYAKITSNSSYASGTKSSGGTTVGVSAKPSYTVSYNANGGSGAPGNQTKWYGDALTLSSTKPTRTGYSFVGWGSSSTSTTPVNQPGGRYDDNSSYTYYAIWKANTYTVSYNANGGSGAPGNQTKTYGVNLTLSSTKPTRTNYNFKGWSTSSNGGVAYAAGATYTNNSAVTLYAVWELAYIKPRLTNFVVNRCTSNGTISESGTYLKVTFSWATDKTVSAIKIEHKLQTASSWTSTAVTASGTSGSVSQVIGGGGISTESSYHVRAYVSDSDGTTYSSTLSIGTVKFPIDIRNQGKGVAVGKVAESDNLFDVGWNSRFRGNVTVDGDIQAHAKVVSICGSDTSGTAGWYKVASQTMSGYGNTNVLYYIKAGYSQRYYGLLEFEMRSSNTSIACWECRWLVRQGFLTSHVRVVISGMTWTLYIYNPSSQYGRVYFSEIQSRTINGGSLGKVITYYNSTTKESASPTASYTVNDAEYISTTLYDNSSGTTGTVTLSETAANFRYLEIFALRDSWIFSTRVCNPNGKKVVLCTSYFVDKQMYLYSKLLTISGASITVNFNKLMWFSNDGTTHAIGDDDSHRIIKVLGYR